ncbi:DUF3619 family protein [Limnobacter humi]|uniref:DUF3619 family protein n=1 Tax=Limnobacter humi TaxID=1778671 RepID=A0ABT1WFF7_9BURK|nr:DUF3619 family protein [Limnobacter humi]MCQ8896252.1 DUF3619 family protein [Limnobacter humi]
MNEERLTAAIIKRMLDESVKSLPSNVQSRLDDSIAKALQTHALKSAQNAQKSSPVMKALPTGGLTGFFETLSGWFNRPALSLALSAAFVAVSVVGVVKYGTDTYNAKVTETADLDAAILSDDLPPDAYLDSGFVNFTTKQPKEGQLPPDDAIDEWIQKLAPEGQAAI